MRILFASPYPPARDGIGTYTQILGGALRAAGHEVAVVAVRADQGAGREVIGALGPWGATDRLRSAVADFDPDLVHVQFAVPAFGARTPALVRWLAELARIPVPIVTTLHEPSRDTALLHGPGRALYRRIARLSDHLIVHTKGALDTLTGPLAVSHAEVIPHFSTPPPEPVSTADELRERFGLGAARLLLAFGYIHVDKGLNDLVQALVLMHRRDSRTLRDVRLVVAGAVRPRSGPFRVFEARDRLHLALVRRSAKRGGVADRLVFTGFVPGDDIAAWFDAAETVVLPYRKAEQSGVANLARAYGVPVIATTAGGLGELFAGSPGTVSPRSPERLAETLAAFLATEPGITVPQGPQDAELGTVAAATTAVYRTAVAGPRGRSL
ncbi:glycosyltransferase [Actinomadura sp. BRA 177]|uniref:glycosyltransferase n=1 Tax=Actinomadura sp. BRA 177 TaxID=2745202 RepID=UPI0015960250|nr:glycosyltransferase [Actinomadura sp. BRA 177]NVI88372.1 glycosyltransferase [Actinomadura sp. BRA 177]